MKPASRVKVELMKSESYLACFTAVIWQPLPCPVGPLWLLRAGRVCLLLKRSGSALPPYVQLAPVFERWVVVAGFMRETFH